MKFDPKDKNIIGINQGVSEDLWTLNAEKFSIKSEWLSNSYITTASLFNKKILVGSSDGKIGLFSQNGSFLKSLIKHEDSVLKIDVNEKDKIIFSLSKKSIKIQNENGSLISVIYPEDNRADFRDFKIDPTGQRLFVIDTEGRAALWDREGNLITNLDGHYGRISNFDFSISGKELMTISFISRIDRSYGFIWETSTGSNIGPFDNLYSSQIKFHPTGDGLLSISRDLLLLTDFTGRTIIQYRGHISFIKDIRYIASDDRFITAGEDATIRIWESNGDLWKLLRGHSSPITGIDISPNNKIIVSVDQEGIIKLWDYEKGEETHNFKIEDGLQSYRHSIRFSPDGKKILLSNGEKLTFLDMEGALLKEIYTNNSSTNFNYFSGNHSNQIFPSRKFLVNIWSASEGGILLRFDARHSSPINSLAISPNSKYIATAGSDKKGIIWSKDGSVVKELLHEESVNSISFSKDGKWVASASDDGFVRIWNLNGKIVKKLDSHKEAVNSVLFSPDGKYLASSDIDGNIYLWDIKTWEDVDQFEIPPGAMRYGDKDALGFSPDGNILSYGIEQVYVQPLNQKFRSNFGIKDIIFTPIKEMPSVREMPDKKQWLTVQGNHGTLVLSLGLDYEMKKGCNWIEDFLQTQMLELQHAGNVSEAESYQNLCSDFLSKN